MNIPIRQEIEILGPDMVKPLKLHNYFYINKFGKLKRRAKVTGFSAFETIGISIINPRAIKKLFIGE